MTMTLGSRQNTWAVRGLTSIAGPFANGPGNFRYSATESSPTQNVTNGLHVFTIPNAGGSPSRADCALMLSFWIKRNSSSTEAMTVRARVWGISNQTGVSDSYFGKYLFECEARMGQTPGEGSTTFPSTARFCSAIRWITDTSLTPSGLRALGNSAWPPDLDEVPQEAGPGIAVLAFDATGFRHLVVEVRREGGGSTDQVSFNWKSA